MCVKLKTQTLFFPLKKSIDRQRQLSAHDDRGGGGGGGGGRSAVAAPSAAPAAACHGGGGGSWHQHRPSAMGHGRSSSRQQETLPPPPPPSPPFSPRSMDGAGCVRVCAGLREASWRHEFHVWAGRGGGKGGGGEGCRKTRAVSSGLLGGGGYKRVKKNRFPPGRSALGQTLGLQRDTDTLPPSLPLPSAFSMPSTALYVYLLNENLFLLFPPLSCFSLPYTIPLYVYSISSIHQLQEQS